MVKIPLCSLTLILVGLMSFSSAHPVSSHIKRTSRNDVDGSEGSVTSGSALASQSSGIVANTGVATAGVIPTLISSVSEDSFSATPGHDDSGNAIPTATSSPSGSEVNNSSSSSSSSSSSFDCGDDGDGDGTNSSPSATISAAGDSDGGLNGSGATAFGPVSSDSFGRSTGGFTSTVPSPTPTLTGDVSRSTVAAFHVASSTGLDGPIALSSAATSTPTNGTLGNSSRGGDKTGKGESKSHGRNNAGKGGSKSRSSHDATSAETGPTPSITLGSSCTLGLSGVSSASGTSDTSTSGDSSALGVPSDLGASSATASSVDSSDCDDPVSDAEPNEANSTEPSPTSTGAPEGTGPSSTTTSTADAAANSSIESSATPKATVTATPSASAQTGNNVDATTAAGQPGKATWYNPGLGSCGETDSDSDLVVALATGTMSNGGNCNRSIDITDSETGKTITAKVRDTCPSCGSGDVDMSPSLFRKFKTLNVGTFNVKWSFQ